MMLTFKEGTEQLEKLIEHKITYSFLDQYINKINLNTYKLSLLKLIMDEASLTQTTKDQYIIATMLVEIALDTHESVPENKKVSEDRSKVLSKQLSVLGGDYYSSLYYVLLSKLEAIEFVQVLATAIKDVNEMKMDFYFCDKNNIHDYIAQIRRFESHIICSVANYVGFTNKTTVSIVQDILLLNILIKENSLFINEKKPLYLNHEQIKMQLYNDINLIIMRMIHKLDEKLSTETSSALIKIQSVFKQIKENYMTQMEEG